MKAYSCMSYTWQDVEVIFQQWEGLGVCGLTSLFSGSETNAESRVCV